jgi:hypothetical protein
MKRFLLLTVALFSFIFTSSAQENTLSNGFGFGFQLNQYQKDFGYGISVTSPLLAHGNLAIRLRTNAMYYEHLKNDETTWTSYANLTLGLVGIGGQVSENIRLYGEGGMIGLFPNSVVSSDTLALGGYGLFGFEFFMQKNFNYFIEIGGVGTGATADKLPGKPIYSNGLSISTGFRAYLK